jgi:hypothetical protein
MEEMPAAKSPPDDERRAFTPRALALGLLSALFICGYTFYNDFQMRQTDFIGTTVPYSVYAALFLLLVFLNPLLRLARRSKVLHASLGVLILLFAGSVAALLSYLTGSHAPWMICACWALSAAAFWAKSGRSPLRPFAAGEIVLMLAMSLAACALPASGLMQYLPHMLVMPQELGKTYGPWQRGQPLRHVNEGNPNLFPEENEKGNVYTDYVQGQNTDKTSNRLPPLAETPFGEWLEMARDKFQTHSREVPWEAWVRPLKTWFPVIIVSLVFVLCMARVVHVQWSQHEQLAYPIAEFGAGLLRRDLGRAWSDVFYKRSFWIAFGVVTAYHIINGWHLYDPRMVDIPLQWDLQGVVRNSAWYLNSRDYRELFVANRIYLSVAAFCYFLPTDVSLSMGLCMPLFMVSSNVGHAFGVEVTAGERVYLQWGAVLAMGAMIIFLGRRYYLALAFRAAGFKSAEAVDGGAVWALRMLALSGAMFVVLLMGLGLDWFLALFLAVALGVIQMVVMRVSAETGLPYIMAQVYPVNLSSAFLGPASLGPRGLYFMATLTNLYTMDTREWLGPYAINAFRLGDFFGVRRGRLAVVMTAVLVIGFFAAGAAALYVIYDQGAMADNWGTVHVNQHSVVYVVGKDVEKLKREDKLERSAEASGFERLSPELRRTKPVARNLVLIGAGLVIVNGMFRLRFIGWPIHPVVFLFVGTWGFSNFVWSFLAGWLVKGLVLRIGGGKVYQNLKPVFIGIIIADLVGVVLVGAFGAARYFWLDQAPKMYAAFPMRK